jgi:hypothetical protein
VERNRKTGQNPPRIVAPIEEEEVCASSYVSNKSTNYAAINSLLLQSTLQLLVGFGLL